MNDMTAYEDLRPLSTLSDEEMVQAARDLAREPRRPMGLMDVGFIANSVQDQKSPKGVNNPYWEIIRQNPALPRLFNSRLEPDGSWIMGYGVQVAEKAHEIGLDRFALCARYSWAITSPGDIAWLAKMLDGQAVTEVGAGSGYWAWQMAQAGIDVDAWDANPPGEMNGYNSHRVYYPINIATHWFTPLPARRALMLSWPVWGATYAAETLARYNGDTVIYMGETLGGNCAEDSFFADLEAAYELEDESPFHVTYYGLRDRLQIWRRRG